MPATPTALPVEAPHCQQLSFTSFPSFQAFLKDQYQHWPQQVQQALKLIALNGIVEPLTGTVLPASALRMVGHNYRETLEYQGFLSRHRAMLLMLQQLLEAQAVPGREQLELYCPEQITPFARRLQGLFPRYRGSEYLPDPADPLRRQHSHQDLCALSLADACVDVVVCNELFEHLYDLPAALAEIARILRPGGRLVATFPFAYSQHATIVKARHRPGATPGVAAEAELLAEPEFHGNPVAPEQGSLVYQIPGWEVLDQARAAGLVEATIHWINAPSYGIVGQELPAVLVLEAQAGGG